MSQLFLKILNMSISTSYIILAVLLLRLLLKKAPKWITIVLWGIVAVRLVCPFSMESILSLLPSAETVSPTIMTDQTPIIYSGIPMIDSAINPVISESFTPAPDDSVNTLQIWISILAAVWIIGMVALLIYMISSHLHIRRRIKTAVLLEGNIYQSENVVSPFILGIIKPKIYLPFHMNEKDMGPVVAHEMAHIRRKDHLWKPLGFLLLTLHWFNPLMWLGYVLLCRDIELACDEKVVKKLDHQARADYSQALLAYSANRGVNRRMIAACPLAFGEIGVKNRVKSVLTYKKPAFWLILTAIVACVAVAVCFLTNPPGKSPEQQEPYPSMPLCSELFSEVSTNYEGVYMTLQSIRKDGRGQHVFNIILHNETDQEVTFGETFTMQLLRIDEEAETISATPSLLQSHTTKAISYTSKHYDASQTGAYSLWLSFSLKADEQEVSYKTCVKFNVGSVSDIDTLRERYPDYFAIDASNGLDVYVWQMAQNRYSFGLLPHTAEGRGWTWPELMTLRGASAAEMRVILSTYKENTDIYIIPWQNPISSALASWQILEKGEGKEDMNAKKQAYAEFIRQMLFGVLLNTGAETSEYTFVYNSPVYEPYLDFFSSLGKYPYVVFPYEGPK